MKTQTIDPADFVVSPGKIAAVEKSAAPKPIARKSNHEIQFYQFPRAVHESLIRANYMPALALAAAVYKGWYKDRDHRNPVKLTSALLAGFGASKDQKWKALKVLEESGHFLVERFPGHNPLVMMKWKLVKD
jgi:hypothetical protein